MAAFSHENAMLVGMTLPFARPEISALPPYVPGATAAAGSGPPVKLSSNESPFGPLPSVVGAMGAGLATVHLYPDMFATTLTGRIAQRLAVEPDQVVVAGGSVAVLAHLLQAYCSVGDEVVFAWRSFEAYPILTRLVGATVVAIGLDSDLRHDVTAMAAAVTPRTRVVLLCSPNNPTGPALRRTDFEAFMAAVPRTVLVVLDEAYVEFVRDPEVVDGLAALAAHPNLVLLRTFSKAYGLAGLRVGYAVGGAEVVAPIRACVTPFSVSSLAQAAAVASLDVEDELFARVDRVVAERARLTAALEDLGWNLTDAQGNFVWLDVGEDALGLAAHLRAQPRPILVRPFGGEGVRITVGDVVNTDLLVEALARWPGGH